MTDEMLISNTGTDYAATLRRGQKFIRKENWARALSVFLKMSEDYPDEPDVWLGLANTVTRNRTLKELEYDDQRMLRSSFQAMERLGTFTQEWRDYRKSQDKFLKAKKKELQKQCDNLDEYCNTCIAKHKHNAMINNVWFVLSFVAWVLIGYLASLPGFYALAGVTFIAWVILRFFRKVWMTERERQYVHDEREKIKKTANWLGIEVTMSEQVEMA
jgi:hypothetical protein